MDEHPLIYIRDGASGRRHCLARDSTSPTFVEANPITVLTDALRALTTGGPAVGPVLRSVASIVGLTAINLSVPVVRLTPEREREMVEELLRAKAALAAGPGMPS